MSSLRDNLVRTLDQAEWRWLEPHARRGSLLVVDATLDLIEVGMAMALDDAATVQRWLQQGLIRQPGEAQIAAWNATPERRFMSLIVQPYVLMGPPPADMA